MLRRGLLTLCLTTACDKPAPAPADPTSATPAPDPGRPPIAAAAPTSANPTSTTANPTSATQPPIAAAAPTSASPTSATQPPIAAAAPTSATQPPIAAAAPTSASPTSATQPPIAAAPTSATQPPIAAAAPTSASPTSATQPPIAAAAPTSATQPPIAAAGTTSATQPPIAAADPTASPTATADAASPATDPPPASTREWPYLAWDRAEAITYNHVPYGPGIPLRVYDDAYGWSQQIVERRPLSAAQGARAAAWVAATHGEIEVSACPFPRHAVVFYAGERPVGTANVCFSCGDILVWPRFRPGKKPVGERKQLAGYKQVFPRWQRFFADEVGFPLEPARLRRYRPAPTSPP